MVVSPRSTIGMEFSFCAIPVVSGDASFLSGAVMLLPSFLLLR